MPLIFVRLFKRSPEVKARIAERITKIIAEEAQVPGAGIEVFFDDLPSDSYYLGGKMSRPTAPNVIKD